VGYQVEVSRMVQEVALVVAVVAMVALRVAGHPAGEGFLGVRGELPAGSCAASTVCAFNGLVVRLLSKINKLTCKQNAPKL
jgi:hypothetical protein